MKKILLQLLFITQAFGSPSIGAVYYVSLTFDEMFR